VANCPRIQCTNHTPIAYICTTTLPILMLPLSDWIWYRIRWRQSYVSANQIATTPSLVCCVGITLACPIISTIEVKLSRIASSPIISLAHLAVTSSYNEMHHPELYLHAPSPRGLNSAASRLFNRMQHQERRSYLIKSIIIRLYTSCEAEN
jgi:hypothetical protein